MTSQDHNPNTPNEDDPLSPTQPESEAAQAYEEAENIAPFEAPEQSAEPEAAAAPSDELAAAHAKMAEIKDQMLRVAAEAENTKRRALKEKGDATKFANARFAQGLLSVADNLRRALDSVPAELKENEQLKNLLEGIEATEREMLKTFENNGIKQIDPMGELFNPNYHEVMFEAQGTGQPGGTVIEVMEKGYILHDRLIRPARVGVAKEEGEPGSTVDTEA